MPETTTTMTEAQSAEGQTATRTLGSVLAEPAASPAPAGAPMVSICINQVNEGLRVKATVEAFRQNLGDWPHEFVIIDDAGDVALPKDMGPNVRIFRNAERQGCGRSKVIATEAARGDVLCFIDGHQNVCAGRFSDMVLAAVAEPCIICPAILDITYHDNYTRTTWGHGNYQVPNDKGLRIRRPHPQYAALTADQVKAGHQVLTHMVGVGCTMSRDTLDALGGWNAYTGRWGSQERGLALRAFMANIPIRVTTDTVLGHEFRSKAKQNPAPYTCGNGDGGERNMWHAYYVVCGDPAFDAFIAPQLREIAPRGEAVIQERSVRIERAWFLSRCRRRPDGDLLELLSMRPTVTPVPVPHGSPSAQLADDSLEHIARYARGRCLEFGSGSGAGTMALLRGAETILSIDQDAKFSARAQAAVASERVTWIVAPIGPDGFYDLSASPLRGKYDCVLVDGPLAGGHSPMARAGALPAVWDHLAQDAVVLLDDGKRRGERDIVAQWRSRYPIRATMLPTRRGLWVITRR